MSDSGDISEDIKITPDILLKAYMCGVFPMAKSKDAEDVYWVDPEKRGIIRLDEFHIPNRLKRTINQKKFEVAVNRQFVEVIKKCAKRTENRKDTWINKQIVELYTELHHRGHAHSVECYHNRRLVGGLYGVQINAAFFGESMFSEVTDASKIALVYLVDKLNRNKFELLDTQFITPHLEQFGAVEISRDEYKKMLEHALKKKATFQ